MEQEMLEITFPYSPQVCHCAFQVIKNNYNTMWLGVEKEQVIIQSSEFNFHTGQEQTTRQYNIFLLRNGFILLPFIIIGVKMVLVSNKHKLSTQPIQSPTKRKLQQQSLKKFVFLSYLPMIQCEITYKYKGQRNFGKLERDTS